MESLGFSHARAPFPELSESFFRTCYLPGETEAVSFGQPGKMSDLTLDLLAPLESEDSEIWVRAPAVHWRIFTCGRLSDSRRKLVGYPGLGRGRHEAAARRCCAGTAAAARHTEAKVYHPKRRALSVKIASVVRCL